MDVYKIMELAGYSLSSSGGGCTWFTKPYTGHGSDGTAAYVAITDIGGCQHPISLDQPVLVGIYDVDTSECLMADPQRFNSLRQYLVTDLGTEWLKEIGAVS